MNRLRKNITKKRILSLLMMFTSVAICAQTKFSGVVKDNTGEAMPGVSVVIKGTNIGTVTDLSGAFSLQTDRKEAVLSFSFLGFVTQELKAQPGKLMTVTLLEDNRSHEGVVVIGY